MLQSASERLEDKIVHILATEGVQKTVQIQHQLSKNGAPTTLQGIYRVLRRLDSAGVIVKNGQDFSLRLPWIIDLANLVNSMDQQYLNPQYLNSVLPKKIIQKRTWIFADLQKTNNFWSQVLLAMAQTSEHKIHLHTSPHLWMDLLQPTQERQFLRALFEKIQSSYTVVSNKTPLDTIYVPHIINEVQREHVFFASQDEDIIEKDPTLYTDIIGDFILTIQLPKKISNSIENLYKQSYSSDDAKAYAYMTLQKMRGRIKMVIKKAPDLSHKYYKRFERIFGPLR